MHACIFYMSPGMFINLLGEKSHVDESLRQIKMLYTAYKTALEQWAPKCPVLESRTRRSMWRTRFCTTVAEFLDEAPPQAQCIQAVSFLPLCLCVAQHGVNMGT